MKTIIINIKSSDVDKELSKVTAYTGVKSASVPQLSDIDRIAITDEDAALLKRYWHNAAGILAEQLKDFIISADTGGEEMNITLEVSCSYDNSLTQSVKENMFSFVVAYMARNWFLMTYPEKAPEWDAESNRLLREAARKLYHRRKPTRVPPVLRSKSFFKQTVL